MIDEPCARSVSKGENERTAQTQHHNRLYGNSIMKEFVPMVIESDPHRQNVEVITGRGASHLPIALALKTSQHALFFFLTLRCTFAIISVVAAFLLLFGTEPVRLTLDLTL